MTPGAPSAELRAAFDRLLEELAALEHERWSHWQTYMHEKGQRRPDGSLLLPPDLVARWDMQRRTPYAELTEKMKESDREQVRRYLPLIAAVLSAEFHPSKTSGER